MIQQKMDKKAYFLEMMNGERLHGELLVSYWCMCESSEFVAYLNFLLTLPPRQYLEKLCNICEDFIYPYNAHFLM